jgi:hypothetical protein
MAGTDAIGGLPVGTMPPQDFAHAPYLMAAKGGYSFAFFTAVFIRVSKALKLFKIRPLLTRLRKKPPKLRD